MRRTIVIAFLCAGLGAWGLFLSPIASSSAANGSGSWSDPPSIATARGLAAAVTLPSGNILIAGGTSDGSVALDSAELYDPSTNSWSPAAPLTTARSDFSLIALSDGRALAVGGTTGATSQSSTEAYDPNLDIWTGTGDLFAARHGEMSTLLKDGRVLVAGGSGDQGPIASAEIFDPHQNTWSQAAPMSIARVGAGMTLLSDGRVLVFGGSDGTSVLRSTEIYDPSADTWSPTGQLNRARYFASSQRLENGSVLVAGGFDSGGAAINSAELFEPTSSTWTLTGSLAGVRGAASSALLPDGRVVIAGGARTESSAPPALSDAEVYDPVAASWSTAGVMGAARARAVETQLGDGRVLIAGDQNLGSFLNSAELYTAEQLPGTPTPTGTPTATDTPQAATATPEADTPTATATAGLPVDTATATPASESPVFRILAVRVEPNTGKPDWQHKQPVLKTVQSGETVQLSSYTEFEALPPAAHVAIWSRVTLNGAVVHRGGLTAHLSPDDVGDLWQHTSFRPTAPGQYTLTVSVAVDSTTHKTSTSFVVMGAPARKISFAFNALRIVDTRGRTITSASRGERVFVRADWTAFGTPNTIPVQLGETLQIRAGNGWRALGGPLRTSFDTPVGRHTFAFSFVPGGTYPSLRVVIDLTIGGRTAERATVISLRS